METSEQKTRRKTAALLLNPIWIHQYSVFYQEPEESCSLLEDQKLFRRELKRKFPNQPFLLRIQTLNRGVHQAYLTIYTTGKVDGLKELAGRFFPAETNVVGRSLTEASRRIKAHKIRTQRLQDLTKIFGTVRIRRHDVINKHLLADLDSK